MENTHITLENNTKTDQTRTIAALNDRFRQTYWGGAVMTTRGVDMLDELTSIKLFSAVMHYDEFTEDDDPYGEHDFGQIIIDGQKFFWKIDYYDARMEYGSEDPTNPDVTTRVLTIMLASEY